MNVLLVGSIIITILASFLGLGKMFYLAIFTYTFAANAFFLVSPVSHLQLTYKRTRTNPDDSPSPAATFVEIRPLA